MGQLLETVGWLVILVAGVFLVVSALGGGGTSMAYVGAILVAAPIGFSGVVIIVFGNMLTQLVAIRESSERLEKTNEQLQALFAEVVAGMKRRAAGDAERPPES